MYGEIVRVGPNHVSYIKPEAWKDIFKHKQAGFRPNVKTMNEDDSEPPSDHLPLILESSVEGHAAQRKKLNVAFSERAWRDQEPLVYKHIDWLVGELRDHVDASPNGEAELEIARIFDIVVMKTMCSLSLGAEIETFSPDYESSWVPIALGQIALKAYPLVLFMFRLLTPKALLHGFDTHMANCQPFIKSRLENPEVDRPDILGFLLRDKACQSPKSLGARPGPLTHGTEMGAREGPWVFLAG
ncbi:hypothetical protein MCOR25_009895 [Pyricularia grisea]|nr:hypothetical protein MCOR25_009895 [Pyricularia grisea]